MSEAYRTLKPITMPVRRVLGERPNMTELLDEVEQDQTQMRELLISFDCSVKTYNELPAEVIEMTSGDLIHLPLAKAQFPETQTIETLLGNSTNYTCELFNRALWDMRGLMGRAEKKMPEPNSGFHVWEGASASERLAGGIFMAYGTMMAMSSLAPGTPAEQRYQLRDTLLDGLIEVMALNHATCPNDPMFDAVKSLGWFDAQNPDGSQLFSPIIRDLASAANPATRTSSIIGQ